MWDGLPSRSSEEPQGWLIAGMAHYLVVNGSGLDVVQEAGLNSPFQEFSGQESILTPCCFRVLQYMSA